MTFLPLSCFSGEETDAENFVFVAAVGEVKKVQPSPVSVAFA